MSVARFIADQRTMYRVPHTWCAAGSWGPALSWLQSCLRTGHSQRPSSPAAQFDVFVKAFFEVFKAHRLND